MKRKQKIVLILAFLMAIQLALLFFIEKDKIGGQYLTTTIATTTKQIASTASTTTANSDDDDDDDYDDYDDDDDDDDDYNYPTTTTATATTTDSDYDDENDDDEEINEIDWPLIIELNKEIEERKNQECKTYKTMLNDLNELTRKKYDMKLIDEHDSDSLAENMEDICCTLRKIYLKLNFNCASIEFDSINPIVKGLANLCSIYFQKFPNDCNTNITAEYHTSEY